MTPRSRPRRRPNPASAQPLKTVGTPPVDALKEVHHWADYVELRCLVGIDGSLTQGDLVGLLRLDPEISPESDNLEEDVSQSTDDSDSAEVHASEGSDGLDAAAKVDNRHRLADEVFDLIETRFLMYAEAYPFTVCDDVIKRHARFDSTQETYLFLLLASLGRYLEGHGKLAKSFERLCAEVLRRNIPGADVFVFGTARNNGTRFSGNLVERVKLLAAHLGERLQPDGERISPSENGDRGLDVVASLDTGDRLSSRLVVFAQAATGRNWIDKQHSVTPNAWDQIIKVTAPAVAACMIPFCFRDVSGDWHDPTLVHRSWMFDRFRILHQMQRESPNEADWAWNDPDSRAILDSVCAYQYDG